MGRRRKAGGRGRGAQTPNNPPTRHLSQAPVQVPLLMAYGVDGKTVAGKAIVLGEMVDSPRPIPDVFPSTTAYLQVFTEL